MRFTLVAILLLSLSGLAPNGRTAAPKPSIDDVIESLFELRQLTEVSISPDGVHAAWVQVREDPATGAATRSIYLANLEEPHSIRRITAGGCSECQEHGIAWSPDGKYLAFLSDAEKSAQLQLYAAGSGDGHARKLSSLTGALAAPSWSPDGKTLAVLFIENAPRVAGPLEAMTEDTGVIAERIYNQRLATIDFASGKTRQVSPADLYVHEYDWSPDGRAFVATAAPGPGDDNWYIAQIYVIAQQTGQAKSILKTSMQIAEPHWSPDGNSIAFIGGLMSDEGLNGGDIFVLPATGGEPRDVTPERKASPKWLRWVAPDEILFTENAHGSIRIASLDPRTREVKTLWTEDSHLALSISRGAKTSAVIRDSSAHPPEVWAGPVGEWKQISHVNGKLHPLWGKAGNLHWNNEGWRIQGWLLYPRDYDPSRRYPLIVSVHGGPAGMATSAWPASHDYTAALAAAGYFVLYPNPRGSMGEGEAFTRANVRDFGYGDLRDILAGVDEVLRTLPVDPNRVGITGWSYGGFMSMWAVTQTHRFRAAVAGAGIANWQSYYGENQIDQWLIPYFGASVYDHPPVYARSSPITFIKNVKTPTLILVGERDGECPLPQSYEFWHALKTLGVETQFVVYANEGHGISKPEHRRDIAQRAVAWFDAHLK